MPAIISPLAQQMLKDVPPYLAESADGRAAIDAIAREITFFEDAVATVQNKFWAQLSDADGLSVWETELGLPVEPVGLSLSQRRSLVLAYVQAMPSQEEGREWVAQMTALIGTSWSYEENEPSPYSLRITLPFASSSATAQIVRDFARLITPAHLDLEYLYGEGFVLGVSQLSVDTL